MRLMIAALVLVGCAPPLPRAVPLQNAQPAAQAALDLWQETGPRPDIQGVLADPACATTRPDGSRSVGFINPEHGRCVGGMTHPEAGIFLLIHPEVRYSHSLPHELQHWIRGDDPHRERGVWEPPIGESDTNLVPAANALLRGTSRDVVLPTE